jgi:hypothetical protein
MAKIEIRDERAEIRPSLVARHENVRYITPRELINFYGVASHLRVILINDDGEKQIIQEGRR